MEKRIVLNEAKANNLATQRAMMKEIQAMYFGMKVNALAGARQMMAETGEGFTCTQLAQLTGLSVSEVAAQVSGYCNAGRRAQFNPYRRVECQTKKYVEVTDDGEIIPGSCLTVTKTVAKYYHK